jgi:hypothetical protein
MILEIYSVCRSGIHAHVRLPKRALRLGGRSQVKMGLLYLGPDSILFFALFWHPCYIDPGRYGWCGAGGVEGAAWAVSGEKLKQKSGKCSFFYAAVAIFR